MPASMVKDENMTRANHRILLPVLVQLITLINVSIPYPITKIEKRGEYSPLPRLLVRRFKFFFTDCVKLNCAAFYYLLAARFECLKEARNDLGLSP